MHMSQQSFHIGSAIACVLELLFLETGYHRGTEIMAVPSAELLLYCHL